MRFTTPLISWHDIKPVFSVDFHASGRLATGGADNTVNIWRVECDGSIVFLSQLVKHEKAVNVVRFSPDGQFLATSGDDGIIYLWKQSIVHQVQGMMDSSVPVAEQVESWIVVGTLSRGGKDIYALDWSADSTQLIAGAFDGVVYLWHLQRTQGQRCNEISDHFTIVQGICFDPLNSMIVTQSADRSVRIYKKNKQGRRLYCAHHLRVRVTDVEIERTKKRKALIEGMAEVEEESHTHYQHKYFHDDSIPTFFRRPSWSPEGQLLLLPCGQYFEGPTQASPSHVTWVVTRGNCAKPVACIPSKDVTIVAKFSPILYKSGTPTSSSHTQSTETTINAMQGIEESSTTASTETNTAANPSTNFRLFDLDYKLVFAIATLSSVLIYDTEHLHPIAMLTDAHYDHMTDLAFSPDGKILAVSNTDGYVTLIQFEDGELGEPLDSEHYNTVMKPTMEARIPKPVESKPRKSKAVSGTAATTGSSDATGTVEGSEHAMSTVERSVNEGDEDDEDSEIEGDAITMGSIIDFDDAAAVVPTVSSNPVPTTVRKTGKRVVPTLVDRDTLGSSSGSSTTPTASTASINDGTPASAPESNAMNVN